MTDLARGTQWGGAASAGAAAARARACVASIPATERPNGASAPTRRKLRRETPLHRRVGSGPRGTSNMVHRGTGGAPGSSTKKHGGVARATSQWLNANSFEFI